MIDVNAEIVAALKSNLGERDYQIIVLSAQLAAASKRIQELESAKVEE